ncbi:MAG: hypothetical protein QM763_22945 [Agriterribacter sp.]
MAKRKGIIITAIFILLCSLYTASAQVIRELNWTFPLTRTHTGMLIGNGTQGLMIWGKDNQLNITIGHQGFWDHRSGNDILSRITYQELKTMLYNKDNSGLREVFAPIKGEASHDFGQPRHLGGGRLEILFPTGYQLVKGTLNLTKSRGDSVDQRFKGKRTPDRYPPGG